MAIASILLGMALAIQANAAGVTNPSDGGRGSANLTPISAPDRARGDTAVSRRAVTPEVVARLFAVPADGVVAGRPITLLEALGSARDRSEQTEAARAYWQLSAALGQYRVWHDAAERLRHIEPRAGDAPVFRAARAKTAESLRNAELAAGRAQRALAEIARLSSSQPLPLPADLPHIGPYRTNFDEVYAVQNVPPSMRLIHRTLPLRRKGIDARATAVQASEDAAETAIDLYRAGTVELSVLLSCLGRVADERAALVWDVCQYNREIAGYAMGVAGVHVSPQALVAMLILPASGAEGPPAETGNVATPRALPTRRSSVTQPSGVEPATWLQPVPEGQPAEGTLLPGSGRPTLAPARPTLAPPKPPAAPAESLPVPPKPVADPEKAGPPPARTRPEGQPVFGPNRTPAEGPSTQNPAVAPRMVERQAAATPDAASASSLALYPALVNAAPAARVKHLGQALHWTRNLPQDAGRPTELDECLRGQSGNDRRSVLDAYWLARQRAAEYQVIAGQAEFMEQLLPIVLEHRGQPSGPLDMLRLRAARLACDAAQLEAHVELLESEFELTRRAGRPLDAAWLLPSTVPHAGPYLLKLDAQRPEVVKQAAVQRLAATIPALDDALQEQAAVVVEADSALAAAAAAYQAGGRSIDSLLTCLQGQTAETHAFLQMLSGYNRAIAEYALTVLPPAVSGEQLVQTLVLIR